MSGVPASKAAQLLVQIAARLNDPADVVDPFTLRRWVRDLVALIASTPTSRRHELAELFGALGVCHCRLEDIPASLSAHQNAASYEPTNGIHESNVATCLLQLKQPADALSRINKALARGHTGEARFALLMQQARAHDDLGNSQAARQAFDAALQSADTRHVPHLLRLANYAAGLGYQGDAVELLARYLLARAGKERDADVPAEDVIRALLPDLTPIAHIAALLRMVQSALDTSRLSAAQVSDERTTSAVDAAREFMANNAELMARLAR